MRLQMLDVIIEVILEVLDLNRGHANETRLSFRLGRAQAVERQLTLHCALAAVLGLSELP